MESKEAPPPAYASTLSSRTSATQLTSAASNTSTYLDPRNQLWLSVNQSSYEGGQTIEGHVTISCLTPLPISALFVRSRGYQKVELPRPAFGTSASSDWGNECQKCQKCGNEWGRSKAARSIFDKTVKVLSLDAGTTLTPGQHTFPFTFSLSRGLPATLAAWGGDPAAPTWAGATTYKVKAYVAEDKRLKSVLRLVVNECLAHADETPPQATAAVNNFYTHAGGLIATAGIDRSTYMPGEVVMCKLDLNSTSTKASEKVRLSLMQEIELNANSQTQTQSAMLVTAEYGPFDPLFWGVTHLQFRLPISMCASSATAPPESTGSIIKCTHTLVVDVGPGHVVLRMPIRITHHSSVPVHLPPDPIIPYTTLFRPPYQPDAATNVCPLCTSAFGIFNRKHHCRCCMRVVCGKCSSGKALLRGLGFESPERVCTGCATDPSRHHYHATEAPPFVPMYLS